MVHYDKKTNSGYCLQGCKKLFGVHGGLDDYRGKEEEDRVLLIDKTKDEVSCVGSRLQQFAHGILE